MEEYKGNNAKEKSMATMITTIAIVQVFTLLAAQIYCFNFKN